MLSGADFVDSDGSGFELGRAGPLVPGVVGQLVDVDQRREVVGGERQPNGDVGLEPHIHLDGTAWRRDADPFAIDDVECNTVGWVDVEFFAVADR